MRTISAIVTSKGKLEFSKTATLFYDRLSSIFGIGWEKARDPTNVSVPYFDSFFRSNYSHKKLTFELVNFMSRMQDNFV